MQLAPVAMIGDAAGLVSRTQLNLNTRNTV